MILVFCTERRRGLERDLRDYLDQAPGGRGEMQALGGDEWTALERAIDQDAAIELAEDVHMRFKDDPVEWSMIPRSNRKKKLLISDMDSTIIGQECIDELADFAGKKAEVADITERAMRGELDFEGALTTRVAMLKGLSVDVLDSCFNERIALNPDARTVVQTMAHHGAHCLLVSGGFTFFTARVAKAAGFHADRANTLLISDNKMTGDVQQPILGRQAKLDALNEVASELGCTPEDGIALGDGANDLAMIEAAGLGVAYRAKPVVSERADAAIKGASLAPALFYQGYREAEFVRN